MLFSLSVAGCAVLCLRVERTRSPKRQPLALVSEPPLLTLFPLQRVLCTWVVRCG